MFCRRQVGQFRVMFRELIVQDHVEQRFVDRDASVVRDKSKLAKRFMKKLTRERVVPIISARVS